jgi:predicted kinase
MRLPLLVAVSGPPAAGKSSVAVRLGSALALPVVSRDALKTGMLFTEPPGTPVPYGGEHSVRSWDLFSVITSQLLQAGVSLVIEQAFLRGRGEAFFEPFLPRSRGLLVQCDVSREESLRRFRRRIADPTRQNPTDLELVRMLETIQAHRERGDEPTPEAASPETA